VTDDAVQVGILRLQDLLDPVHQFDVGLPRSLQNTVAPSMAL
jgi:hypothetical protein